MHTYIHTYIHTCIHSYKDTHMRTYRLTQSAMNPWRTQTLFHLLPQRWRKSAHRSIFFRSRFVVHHSLQECDSSFRGGPTVSQSVLSQTGSRGKFLKYRGRGGWVKRNFSSFRSLYQNGNAIRTSSQESTQQVHKSIRCECEIEELSFRTHMCYKTTKISHRVP